MKKAKLILPIVAIVFAVAGAFATGDSTSELLPVPATLGYLALPPNGPNCITDAICTNAGAITCTTGSGVILKTRDNALSCAVNAQGFLIWIDQ